MLSVTPIITPKIKNLGFTSAPPCVNPYLKSQKDSFEHAKIEASDEMKSKFEAGDLERLVKNPIKYKQAETLAKTAVEPKEIASNVLWFFDEKLDAKKLTEKILSVQEKCGENLNKINFFKNVYDSSAITISADLKNSGKRVEVYDKDFNLETAEVSEIQTKNNKTFEIKKSKDYKHNTISKTRSELIQGWKVPLTEVIVKKDDKGNIVYKETSEQSPIKGIMNTKRVYTDGTVKNISEGKISKNGVVTIRKNLESFDGTKTNYEYLDDPQGNRVSKYKIVDKNGNVLMSKEQYFDVISENKFISSENGKNYEINVNEKELNVKDLQSGKETSTELNTYLFGDTKALLKILKQIKGDELISMTENVKRIFTTPDDLGASFFNPANKDITTCDNLYTFVHELGHAKDMKNYDITTFKTKDATESTKISKNKDLLEIYNKERDNFNKNTSETQRNHVDYFISNVSNKGKDGSFSEAVAEINAMLNTYNSVDRFSMRSQYLQQYFPKTIACVAEKLAI